MIEAALGNSQFSFLVFLVIVKKLECVFPRAYPFILGFENSKCYLNRLQSETIGVEHLFHNKTKNSFFGSLRRTRELVEALLQIWLHISKEDHHKQ
jgi:hypothetical protein